MHKVRFQIRVQPIIVHIHEVNNCLEGDGGLITCFSTGHIGLALSRVRIDDIYPLLNSVIWRLRVKGMRLDDCMGPSSF